ncbi:MAG TPA: hypothetical protein VGL58_10330 [Caulobacteraceae bacterium]|jgi:threonine/homoserine/homoserine lactone efflux protein
MSEPLPRATVSPGAKVVGWLMLVVGALMTLLCGACTLTMLVAGLGSGGRSEAGLGVVIAGMGLVIGGVPTLGGLVLIWAGWRILRPPPTPTPRSVSKTFE